MSAFVGRVKAAAAVGCTSVAPTPIPGYGNAVVGTAAYGPVGGANKGLAGGVYGVVGTASKGLVGAADAAESVVPLHPPNGDAGGSVLDGEALAKRGLGAAGRVNKGLAADGAEIGGAEPTIPGVAGAATFDRASNGLGANA